MNGEWPRQLRWRQVREGGPIHVGEPWQWQEEDINNLIREQRPEDLRLEYKKSDSLAKSDAKKTEITKDVSAMANSAGGVIIYGIDEQKKSHGPIQLDGGIDPNEISTEWLEQVIGYGIQRRIDGVIVRAVKIAAAERAAYVVWIPQSYRAPHMAADHRYYKRLGTTTAVMEEYEVRDVGRRSESPDLHLDLTVRDTGTTGVVQLEPRIGNRSQSPFNTQRAGYTWTWVWEYNCITARNGTDLTIRAWSGTTKTGLNFMLSATLGLSLNVTQSWKANSIPWTGST
jgi:hypothetical protein